MGDESIINAQHLTDSARVFFFFFMFQLDLSTENYENVSVWSLVLC